MMEYTPERITKKEVHNGSGAVFDYWEWEYDERGCPSRIADGQGLERLYYYDQMGRLVYSRYLLNGELWHDFEYHYDKASNRVKAVVDGATKLYQVGKGNGCLL